MKLYKIKTLVWEEITGFYFKCRAPYRSFVIRHYRVTGECFLFHHLYNKDDEVETFGSQEQAKARAQQIHEADMEKYLEVVKVGFVTPSGNHVVSCEC